MWGRRADWDSRVVNVECLSVFIPWPVASCRLRVANCQLSVVKVIGVVRAIGCLDSQVRAQTCLPWSVTHAEYVTSGSTWPEVTTCHEDSSLIGEPNTCLACPSLSLISFILHTAFIYLLSACQSSRHNFSFSSHSGFGFTFITSVI